jgi:hypothetical protein
VVLAMTSIPPTDPGRTPSRAARSDRLGSRRAQSIVVAILLAAAIAVVLLLLLG